MPKYPNKNSRMLPYKIRARMCSSVFLNRQSLIWILILFVSSGLVLAQTTTGTLVGNVIDPSGAGMGGVSVVALEIATNHLRPVTTNDSGNYSIPNLPPGRYQVG